MPARTKENRNKKCITSYLREWCLCAAHSHTHTHTCRHTHAHRHALPVKRCVPRKILNIIVTFAQSSNFNLKSCQMMMLLSFVAFAASSNRIRYIVHILHVCMSERYRLKANNKKIPQNMHIQIHKKLWKYLCVLLFSASLKNVQERR